MNKTYEDGLNDAWKAARRICMYPENGGLELSEMKKIFGTDFINNIFSAYDAVEAKKRLEEYDKSKFRAGDVVKCCRSFGIVTAVAATDGYYWVMWSNGLTEYCDSSRLEKADCSLPDLTRILSNLKNLEGNCS